MAFTPTSTSRFVLLSAHRMACALQAAHAATMEKYKIKRDGLPPIAFEGEKIASGCNHSHNGDRQNRYTTVRIYRTKGGRYIVEEHYSTCWQGEDDSRVATSCATPEEVVQWLRGRNDDGEISSVAQEAIEEAAGTCPEFAAAWVEVVE